jgi:acetyl/propionyl-CoA carboxylase alpha subunit
VRLPGTVLVANRGEVAARILRTLRRLDIRSAIVYHSSDRHSIAVRDADVAIEIFGDTPVGAYLDIASIIAAAQEVGADAIHPGFGFLSERAEFAEAVAAAGMRFVGPPPSAIRAMGDKIESKRLAEQAGVPILPSSPDAVTTREDALREATRIGYPVLLKASAGGGGKGMRIAHDAAECATAYDTATTEAAASFGDGRVYVERYVSRPRHIEVQVLADTFGNVIHLGERECSIQRRYQKVIEEAPSPFLDEETRDAMTATACALAKSVGYASAGTVEMIVDENRQFFFLEMNTRLQVEHPVTELITGVDIVEQQLRVAAGEPLSLSQADITVDGHAIEARVYAEDADNGYLPETGRLHLVRLPSGSGIRVDHSVFEGQEVTAAFDPMIAKVAAHGRDRAEAIARLRHALRGTVLLGVRTNTAFLERVLAHPSFAAGDTTTAFLVEHADDVRTPEPTSEQELLVTAVAALSSRAFDRRYDVDLPAAAMGAWRP